MRGDCILSANDLSIGYKNGKNIHCIHRKMEIHLFRGELTSLLGPNGAGKSTLLRTLSASQPPLSGDIRLENKKISEYTEHERSMKIGIVLTDRTQVGGLSVYELVALGRQPHTGFFGQLHNQDKEIVQKSIEDVGLSHKMNSYMAELSDGERQKAMIAKALVQECPLILLDEPTAFLDAASRIEIMGLLHRFADEQGKCILLSTHDIEQALILSDKIWLLSPSTGLQCGVTEDIILSDRMDNLFNKEEICFDRDHGIYYPTIHWKKEIHLSAANDTLLHWGINALNRNGFRCILSDRNGENYEHRLDISSNNEMTYTFDGKREEIHSFEELVNLLKQN
ncbi:MAG: ABC transporter ATP-binding protein [Paludibacteraceae bacterium]